MTTLGLNYGERRIGLAISQSGIVAQGWGRLPNLRGKEIARIGAICQQHQVSKIVVGLPRSLNNLALGPAAQIVKKYGQQLEQELHLPVYFEDETLTTNEAENNLRALGWNQAKIASKIDEESAKLILQSYIDRQK